MKIFCAWCGADMGEKNGKGVEGVTHSICPACQAKLEAGGRIELKRRPAICCPEPGCDKNNCLGCEYLGKCKDDPQRADYCPRPRTCPNCGTNCLKCPLWKGPIVRTDFSKMTEGQVR